MEVKQSDFDKVFNEKGTKKEFLNLVQDSVTNLMNQIGVIADAVEEAISDESINLYNGYDLEQLRMELIHANCALSRVIDYKNNIERDLAKDTEENISL